MRIAYFDTFSGIAGDMTLGALLDLGLPMTVLEEIVSKLELSKVELRASETTKNGIRATHLEVFVDGRKEQPGETHAGAAGPARHGHDHPHDHAHGHDHPHDHAHGPGAGLHSFREIRARVERANLGAETTRRAQAVFRALAIAEGRVHGKEPEDVHFHEVGAADALVDIVGTAAGLVHLGIERIHAGPLPLGDGFVQTDHGRMPVPAPATLELLRGFSTRPLDGGRELVTPTGAAILAALADPAPAPPLRPLEIGYGAGTLDLADRPNLLRIVLAEEAPTRRPAGVPPRNPAIGRDTRVVLETNLDDMNPEFYEAAITSLFDAGALDVTLGAVTMKRGRPGSCLQVIAREEDEEQLTELILSHTTSIGVRRWRVDRSTLARSQRKIATGFGQVACKVVVLPDGSERITPEAQDLLRAAREHDTTLEAVRNAVDRAIADGPADSR